MNNIIKEENRPAVYGLEYNLEQKRSINKIDNFIDSSNHIIKHFINALNHLVLVEMDGKEWANKKKQQPKIIPYYKDDKGDIIFGFNTSDLLINKPFPLINRIDSYGTATYDINGNIVTLLNTYGEEEEMRDRYYLNDKYSPIISLCYLYGDSIEVADIVMVKKIIPRKKFVIKNHMIGIVPKELINIQFSGKDAFYFYPNDRFVSLKINNKDYNKIPQIYKHKDSEDWASEPRIKIHLELST